MLSYRHVHHAGNFADVLKHAAFAYCLDYLRRKEKPFLVLDTHAGGGEYDLQATFSLKLREHERGAVPIYDRVRRDERTPDFLAPWRRSLDARNDGPLRRYPGSPAIALDALRRQDRALFFELHGREAETLAACTAGRERAAVRREDGLRGLVAATPPVERRMIALVDPSYELKSDYEDVVAALSAAWRRFPQGVYVVWRPVIDRARTDAMAAAIRSAGIRSVFDIELCVSPDTSERGMTGSGLWIVNPPYTLPAAASAALEWIAQTIGAAGPRRADWLTPE